MKNTVQLVDRNPSGQYRQWDFSIVLPLLIFWQKLKRRVLTFFLREKRREFLFIFLREKKERNKNNQMFSWLFSPQKRVWGNLGAHTLFIQKLKNRQEDRGLVVDHDNYGGKVWISSYKRYSLNPFPSKLNFELICVIWRSYLHVCVMMHIKYLYNF